MKQRGGKKIKTKNSLLLEGVLKRHPEGFGFFIPDDKNHPDVYIPSGKIGSALTNDRVRVLIQPKRGRRPQSFYGSVHTVLKREKEFVVGSFKIKLDQMVIRNHNLTCSMDIPVSNPKKIPVKEEDCVKARIRFSPKAKPFFRGELTANFGRISSSAKDDVKRIMADYNIPFDFPEEVLKEVEGLPDEVREKDCFDRTDLRDKAFVTIDGATAQDFDDAICVEKHSQSCRLYVAIADVSYYVQEDSSLDKEAFERGNSSYFPGFCSPMLPEKLSNDLCSLKPDVSRLAMVQEMDFDFQGELIKAKVYPAVIKSQKRLTYGQAQDVLDGLSSLKGEYLESLKSAQSLAQILLKQHNKGQAFNLDIPESLVLVDERGETQSIIKEKRLFSHLMIEQFMLSANKAVSAFLEKRKTPLLYRIHESPEEDKLKNLQKFSKMLGFSQSFKSRKNFFRFLNQYESHKRIELIHKLVLRSLSQARYSAFNKGHYGLNFSSYTHFTSPIRRYCDLLIHRLIKRALSNSGDVKPVFSQKEMEKKAVFISQKEQNSVKAERRITDIKKARFLKQHVGKSFSGYVSSISSFGLFVTLRNFEAEGLIRFQDLPGFWETDEFQLYAKNKRNAYQIRFGDEVEVLICASNVSTGNVDMRLLSHKIS